MKAVAKPCPGCPFAKSTPPGALGGSTVDVYAGQLLGPFALPCHSHYGPDGKGSTAATAADVPQCAGAAVLRGHHGGTFPESIPILPPNPDVFASVWDFIAHHVQVSRESALRSYPPVILRLLTSIQLLRAKMGMKP